MVGGKPMLGRCRDLVQHPNQPRPTAADSIEADDEEARAYYYHNHPPGREGQAPREGSLVWFLCNLPIRISNIEQSS